MELSDQPVQKKKHASWATTAAVHLLDLMMNQSNLVVDAILKQKLTLMILVLNGLINVELQNS